VSLSGPLRDGSALLVSVHRLMPEESTPTSCIDGEVQGSAENLAEGTVKRCGTGLLGHRAGRQQSLPSVSHSGPVKGSTPLGNTPSSRTRSRRWGFTSGPFATST
jgi:hypothetical protein